MIVSRNVDVSTAAFSQAEVTIAADPHDQKVLLAGSNGDNGALAYSSEDGGKTWTSRPNLSVPAGLCAVGDPSLAIDRAGRQLYAYLADSCSGFSSAELRVAFRAGPGRPWRVSPPIGTGAGTDDKPELTIDDLTGRLYLVWNRLGDVVLRSSSDGAHWSPQVRVSAHFAGAALASIAASHGTVFVAWVDPETDVIRMTVSRTGGRFTPERTVARLHSVPTGCRRIGSKIPAQPLRCVISIPHLVVAGGRVYLVYDDARGAGARDVFVAAFDERLSEVLRTTQVNPADGAVPADEFLPATAIDRRSGRLWICFYDTRADRSRRTTRYSCTWSNDGGARWHAPMPVAAVRSDETRPPAQPFEYGDYTGVAVAGGVAHPVWTDSRDLATYGEEIYTAAVTVR